MLAGITPLWEGSLYPIGQIGSLVEIPQGPVKLVASVTLVGIAELSGVLEPSAAVQVGDRWLQVQLLGEIDGVGRFHRGVRTYPGLDDPVHFTTPDGLRTIFPPPADERVLLGTLASAPDVTVALSLQALVTRHAAIVGSTGSGKTSAVASLLQNLVRGGWTSANVVIVDPHGEYSRALEASAKVKSVLGPGTNILRVPFWAFPASDILRVFCGQESATVQNRFSELVTTARRKFVQSAAWLDLDPSGVSADTPVPFDIYEVWFQLDYDNNATYSQGSGKGAPEIEHEGLAAALTPTRFRPYSMGSAAPFKGPLFGLYGTAPDRLRLRLTDPRFRFLVEPKGTPEGPDPLPAVIVEWLGNDCPLSVLDFSGVPTEATDLAVGLVLQMLFELSVRSRTKGIGRPRPVLVVLEEAHRYLGDSATTRVAKESANRIAREGRKYGVGLLLVTQRPSELPETALSQVGTVLALRLTNATDQSTVRAALPDAVAGLAEALPALRTGEAIVAGEAVALPCRVQIIRPHPTPKADDPPLLSWRKAALENDVAEAIARWRGSQQEDADDDQLA
ncbi:MAG TPA: ATP-binding protein [Thermoanaerobaculia bacterium]|nr:ATP-binding protein [Thermoanaerobaculia bacterium]